MPFVEEKLFRGECDGAGSQVVVTPEGKVGPCLAFMGDDRFLEYQRQGKFNFNIKEICAVCLLGISLKKFAGIPFPSPCSGRIES